MTQRVHFKGKLLSRLVKMDPDYAKRVSRGGRGTHAALGVLRSTLRMGSEVTYALRKASWLDDDLDELQDLMEQQVRWRA